MSVWAPLSHWATHDWMAREVSPARRREERHPPGTPLLDQAWLAAVDRLDAVLRWHYGVQEYSTDPRCVLRIALDVATRPVVLSDGTTLSAGSTVGTLHFWNEHLPRFPPEGPGLGWAKTMHSRIRFSLRELCRHLERDAAWRDVPALRADAPLPFRPTARRQMRCVAERHGFESERGAEPAHGRVRTVTENLLLWGFARAYNPAALARHDLRRSRQALWLSRQSLFERYGPGA